jgi:uncharacterized protein (DUF2147 family)
MMLAKITAAASTLGFLIAPAFAGDVGSPEGAWQVTSGESQYEVAMCDDGTALCATLVWLREDARSPENPGYLNKQVVHAEMSQPMTWEGQVTYEGDTYAGYVTMVGHSLQMTGCKAILCKSMIFERV